MRKAAELSGEIALLLAGGAAREQAIARLYFKYGRDFKSYFRRHGARDPTPEDLLQDTFIQVLRSIDGWRGDGSVEAWLWAIARNTLLSHLRRSKQTVSLDAEDMDADDLRAHSGHATSNPADADCVKRELTAFATAFPEYAHVLERVAVDGWGDLELAQYRGCKVGAARQYLSQCRKRVWQYIGHCY